MSHASAVVSRRMPAAAASYSLGLDPSARMRGRFLPSEESGRKEVMDMAIYKILRIYEVPAESQIEATNRMMEALVLHVERDFHVIDYVKTPEDADGKGHKIDLNPPKGWLSLLLQELAAQLTGRPVKDDRPWIKPKVYEGKSVHEQELGKR